MATTVASPLDFWRLAELAERRGIKIMVEPISGEHFATSASTSNTLYRLTHHSCSCKGFMTWQRCTHFALFLKVLGWLPDPEPEPEPAAPAVPAPPAPCAICEGSGRERLRSATGRSFAVVCDGCGGTGHVAAPAPATGQRPPIRPTNPAADELAPWEREAA